MGAGSRRAPLNQGGLKCSFSGCIQVVDRNVTVGKLSRKTRSVCWLEDDEAAGSCLLSPPNTRKRSGGGGSGRSEDAETVRLWAWFCPGASQTFWCSRCLRVPLPVSAVLTRAISVGTHILEKEKAMLKTQGSAGTHSPGPRCLWQALQPCE